jgi:hypothetical protein
VRELKDVEPVAPDVAGWGCQMQSNKFIEPKSDPATAQPIGTEAHTVGRP